MIRRLINHAGVLADKNKSIVKWSANERTKKFGRCDKSISF
jgi:hypothetical protein